MDKMAPAVKAAGNTEQTFNWYFNLSLQMYILETQKPQALVTTECSDNIH